MPTVPTPPILTSQILQILNAPLSNPRQFDRAYNAQGSQPHSTGPADRHHDAISGVTCTASREQVKRNVDTGTEASKTVIRCAGCG